MPSVAGDYSLTAIASDDDSLYATSEVVTISVMGDDVQVISVGQGSPSAQCVTFGSNGILDSTVGGDDQRFISRGGSSDYIHTGANGICETTAGGDDVQVIPVGQGRPNILCITNGVNSVTETTPGGDDTLSTTNAKGATVSAGVYTGTNGICESTANQ